MRANVNSEWSRSLRKRWGLNKPIVRSSESFHRELWPLSADHASPIPNVFLGALGSTLDLERHPFSLSRDGLVPLTMFFLKFPLPPAGFRSRILIDDRLSGFVPRSWRKHFGTYRIVSFDRVCKRGPKTLVIVGLAADWYLPKENLDALLTRAREWCRESKVAKSKRHLAFVGAPPSASPLYSLQLAADLAQVVPLRFIDWRQFSGLTFDDSNLVLDLQQGAFCADNVLVHQGLSKGALLLNPANRDQKIEKHDLMLSPHHGYKVRRKLSDETFSETALLELEKLKKVFEKLGTARGRSWPTYLGEWAHDRLLTSCPVSP